MENVGNCAPCAQLVFCLNDKGVCYYIGERGDIVQLAFDSEEELNKFIGILQQLKS